MVISENTRLKAERIGIVLNGDFICEKCRLKIHDERENRPSDSNLEMIDEPMDVSLDEPIDEMQQPIEPVHIEPSSSKSIDLPRLRSKTNLTPMADASSESSGSEVVSDVDGVLDVVNNLCTALNLPVLDKLKLRYNEYSTNQLNQLIKLLRKTVFEKASESQNFDHEIVEKLKRKYYDESTDQNTKFKILSIMLDSWSTRKIEQEMGVTFHAANISMKLVAQHGVFIDIAKKTGGSVKLSPETTQQVNQFYNDERFSRTMLGIKDYKVKRENGEKVEVQRRLLIMNLKELYKEFKKENPNVKIGFSTFASLKPLECLTSIDANGIHCVCV